MAFFVLSEQDRTSKLVSAPRFGTSPARLQSPQESSEEDLKPVPEDGEAIRSIARQFSTAASTQYGPSALFSPEPDSPLNPASSHFDVRKWVKTLLSASDSSTQRSTGVAFRGLTVRGEATGSNYQKTFGNLPLAAFQSFAHLVGGGKGQQVDILRDFVGVVNPGEMLVVLGPPGSGCSTLLKTLACEWHGLEIDDQSYINFSGLPVSDMRASLRGDAIYTAENDVHFPQMTVGQTLRFAATARSPKNLPEGITRKRYAECMRDAVMAVLGIFHTMNTRVGNDFVRGVSGGERKRVSIAEAILADTCVQMWDNSTRGLDSANAIEFCRTLRIAAELVDCVAGVAIYQAPQAAYDCFDKVTVLYEGRQIYFGPATEAKDFFVDMGFECPDRQTTPDFLTSLTSPAERVVRKGFEGSVPQTADDFAARWIKSEAYNKLMDEIIAFDRDNKIGGPSADRYKAARQAQQSKWSRTQSAYMLSYPQQVGLCLTRGFQRLRADPSLFFTQIFSNTIIALIVGSVFYNLAPDTASFFSRGSLLFFAVLLNAFGAALEILTLYEQRPIIEKHMRFAFAHPSAEGLASMITDLPYKVLNNIFFNVTIYFLSNLRREAGNFFFFMFVCFLTTLVMSSFFRCAASVSRTLDQALVPSALFILMFCMYAGFALQPTSIPGWSSWMRYLNPVFYAFEALMENEFGRREFACSDFVPSGPAYDAITGTERVCTVVGSVPGSNTVQGQDFLTLSYNYSYGHRWRNVGILFVFLAGLTAIYLLATELIPAARSKGEILLFRRGHLPAAPRSDEESGRPTVHKSQDTNGKESAAAAVAPEQESMVSFEDICYDVNIKGETRRILDHVSGFIKPGTLTALMGSSGAGKTTLLDCLAGRITMGVVTGDVLVNGQPRDDSFQRRTGYVQQQDVHLQTATVREALTFSAILRQPAHVSRAEKLDYVEEVIRLLDMEAYADAIVGEPGVGLNVEQRKRLSIAVELAAKPDLLLFLDEPTSGLDSQTSWSILDLLEKLTNAGQAILCTVHQPSAMLFQRFDRLLFLMRGGRTAYFGPIGENSRTLLDYFEKNGGYKCPDEANPAEYMLAVIGAAPGSHTDIDWPARWNESQEKAAMKQELARLRDMKQLTGESSAIVSQEEFAASFFTQWRELQGRAFIHYWRTPIYLTSKFALLTLSGLYVGFTFFKAPTTQIGIQNQVFSVFMIFVIFGQLAEQIMPFFVTARKAFEVRERPSKIYSWKVFMLSQICVELPWATIFSIPLFFTFYYPVGFYNNAVTDSTALRGFQAFLFIWLFLLYNSTFSHFCIAGVENAEVGGAISNLLFAMSLTFCGVLASPAVFPGFWIFMYRVSPFTYIVEGLITAGLANAPLTCADNEYLRFTPPTGQDCQTYLAAYQNYTGGIGFLQDPASTTECVFCQYSTTNQRLTVFNLDYGNYWRDFGLIWVFIIFNIVAAVALYWLFRVPRTRMTATKTAAPVPATSEKLGDVKQSQ